jgi:hypothetical protein
MNEFLRERITRKLDTLSDERAYQVLDYIEFLESKYAQRTSQSPSVFQRFAEGVQDTMRAGRISAATIGETMSLLNKAMGVLDGAAAAGKSVANDVVNAVSRQSTRETPSAPPTVAGPTAAPAPSPTPNVTPNPSPSSDTAPNSGATMRGDSAA